jgi:hypothetical protein
MIIASYAGKPIIATIAKEDVDERSMGERSCMCQQLQHMQNGHQQERCENPIGLHPSSHLQPLQTSGRKKGRLRGHRKTDDFDLH